MSGMTNNLAVRVLDHVLRSNISGTELMRPSAVYLALHSADPGETGAHEITGGGYLRKLITFAEAVGGLMSNDVSVLFVMPSCSVTHFTIQVDPTTVIPIFTGALPGEKVFNYGDTFNVQPGIITLKNNNGS